MKCLAFFLIYIISFKPAFCQSITNKDSVNATYKIFEGSIKSNRFEGGYSTYTLVVSEYYNYIEISSVYWKSIIVKYRLEKLSNFQVFSITRTMSQENDSVPSYYIAIDSNTANKIKKGERGFNDLNNEEIYKNLNELDLLIFPLFLKIIIKHNLQTEYLKYEPRSFVAWLKVRN